MFFKICRKTKNNGCSIKTFNNLEDAITRFKEIRTPAYLEGSNGKCYGRRESLDSAYGMYWITDVGAGEDIRCYFDEDGFLSFYYL